MKAHGRTNVSRWHTDETWRCASEARWRAGESRWPTNGIHGCVDEARRRFDEARWRPDESRWRTGETRRCASEARWRAHVLHGSTSQCSWVHLRASRTGVSGSLAFGRVSSELRTTLVTAENRSKGPGKSFEGEAKSFVDAHSSELRLKWTEAIARVQMGSPEAQPIGLDGQAVARGRVVRYDSRAHDDGCRAASPASIHSLPFVSGESGEVRDSPASAAPRRPARSPVE